MSDSFLTKKPFWIGVVGGAVVLIAIMAVLWEDPHPPRPAPLGNPPPIPPITAADFSSPQVAMALIQEGQRRLVLSRHYFGEVEGLAPESLRHLYVVLYLENQLQSRGSLMEIAKIANDPTPLCPTFQTWSASYRALDQGELASVVSEMVDAQDRDILAARNEDLQRKFQRALARPEVRKARQAYIRAHAAEILQSVK